MSEFYIKQLGRQELGVNPDGTVARGRYIYITKAYENFFPHLSTTVKNDNVLLPIIPPFGDSKIYTTLVYHNDKYNSPEGTRDEFRLYLNKDLDPERSYFHPEDIVVFQKMVNEELQVPIYLLYKFSAEQPEHARLLEIINVSSIRGGHALVNGELDFLPARNIDLEKTTTVIPQEIIDVAITQQEEVLNNEEVGVEDTRGASLFGPDSFRDFVMMAYGYKCAVTGQVISYKKLNNLDTAHIQPKAQAGTFLPCNGIALSKDMHWAFDKGFITISDDYKIIVHDEMKTSSLSAFDNKPIFVPADPYFQPEKKFLKHRRENIFGLFLHSGVIRSTR